MDGFYGRGWSLAMGLVAVACLHHRVTWVHPFRDGNGRAARLFRPTLRCSCYPRVLGR